MNRLTFNFGLGASFSATFDLTAGILMRSDAVAVKPKWQQTPVGSSTAASSSRSHLIAELEI